MIFFFCTSILYKFVLMAAFYSIFLKLIKASEKKCSFGIYIYIFGECRRKKKCDPCHILFVRKEEKDEREFWEGGDMDSPMTDS